MMDAQSPHLDPENISDERDWYRRRDALRGRQTSSQESLIPTSDVSPEEPVPWARPSVRRPELQIMGHRGGRGDRRPITCAEVAILSLSVSIVLACFFVGFAIVYRLRVGPGMEAPAVAAVDVKPAPTEILATLVPTFTPTPPPTVLPPVTATITLELPTPSPEPTLPVPTPDPRPPAGSPPTRLVIPKISLDIPVLPVGVKTVSEGGTSKVVWDDVPNGGAFHQNSAYPGNPGNTVINGHRDIQGSVFRHLDRVEVDDEIILYVGDVAYPYRVTETLVVPETFASAEQRAENLRFIGYMPEERLTLVTCTPVGLATHRLLVVAKPSEPPLPQMPEAGSGDTP